PAGSATDPVTFSFEVETPATPTTTTLAASATDVTDENDVTLTATVAPADAEGTVTFASGNGAAGGDLGEPVKVENGTASLTTSDLPVGANTVTARFTPSDPERYEASEAAAVTINVRLADAATTTSLAVEPAAPIALGEEAAFTATVTPAAATGSVEFFETPAGGSERSLGTAAVSDGTAKLSTANLAAGGHKIRAVFTSDNGYDRSETLLSSTARGTTTITNYGVVDPAQTGVCTPSGGETLTGVTATWGWSAYSEGWEKFGGGNVAVDGEDFVLSEGVATRSENCTSIAFQGTLRVEAYQSFFPANGQWVELVNPELVIDGSGNGAWIAGVRSGEGTLDEDTSEPVVVAEIANAEGIDFARDAVNGSVELAYANTTAPGTWSADWSADPVNARGDAWSNAFILQVPSMIRSFYYASGAGGDVKKAPAALGLSWSYEAATPTAEVLDSKGEATSSVKQGDTVTFSAAPFRPGTEVSVARGSEELGTVTADADGVAAYRWTVPEDLEVGEQTVTLSDPAREVSASAQFEVTQFVRTTTGLSTSAKEGSSRENVEFVATVSPDAAPGEVTFTNNGEAIGTVAVENGVARVTADLALGENRIVASFASGSDAYSDSVSDTLVITVSGGDGVGGVEEEPTNSGAGTGGGPKAGDPKAGGAKAALATTGGPGLELGLGAGLALLVLGGGIMLARRRATANR
ncbi:Ig-like domain-containing protein, partial [Leucobacter sp. wl10]|uniref:Ig-like domain-containing protein n=1 Tax=Leucobacter sp. wl10 TaxID=2304677 RepID=UPI000E90DD32